MKINITNMAEAMEDKTLMKGLYTVEVVNAKILQTRRGFDQLVLNMVVQDGPAQLDGRSPVGTEVADFIILDENASDKPKGPAFIRQRVGNVFGAFEVPAGAEDEHVFVGKMALAQIEPGEDQDGFPRDVVKRYRKAL